MKITVEKPSEALLNKLGVKTWPTWTKEVSKFDYHYDDLRPEGAIGNQRPIHLSANRYDSSYLYDEKEVCFILAGKVNVKAGDETVSFSAGDLVTFPEGLDCVWEVLEPVRKHYKFG